MILGYDTFIKRSPMKKTPLIPGLAIGLFLAQTAAQAQTPADFIACTSISDSVERLSCFDTAAAGLVDNVFEAAATAPEVGQQTTSAEAPSTAAESNMAAARGGVLPSWFPRVSRSARSEQEAVDEPDSYVTKVVEIERNNIGRYFFTTEEGFVWRQLEIRRIRVPQSLPTDVEIRQGAMGSTRLKLLETGRSYTVRRVE